MASTVSAAASQASQEFAGYLAKSALFVATETLGCSRVDTCRLYGERSWKRASERPFLRPRLKSSFIAPLKVITSLRSFGGGSALLATAPFQPLYSVPLNLKPTISSAVHGSRPTYRNASSRSIATGTLKPSAADVSEVR